MTGSACPPSSYPRGHGAKSAPLPTLPIGFTEMVRFGRLSNRGASKPIGVVIRGDGDGVPSLPYLVLAAAADSMGFRNNTRQCRTRWSSTAGNWCNSRMSGRSWSPPSHTTGMSTAIAPMPDLQRSSGQHLRQPARGLASASRSPVINRFTCAAWPEGGPGGNMGRDPSRPPRLACFVSPRKVRSHMTFVTVMRSAISLRELHTRLEPSGR
jgi:hypothetical protein